MPCRDGGPCYENDPVLVARLDKVTRLLCEVLTIDPTVADRFNVVGLKEWWVNHQAMDAARKLATRVSLERQLADEEREAAKAAARVKALRKKLERS